MILELTPKEGGGSQKGQDLSDLETSFDSLAVSETREKDVADLEYSISKITLEGGEDEKESQEDESSEVKKEECSEAEKVSHSSEPSSYYVPDEAKVKEEEDDGDSRKDDEVDKDTDEDDKEDDSSEEGEKESAVSEPRSLVEDASDSDKDEERSSSERETTKDGSDTKKAEDDEEEKGKEHPKEPKSGKKVNKESKGKQLLTRGLGSGLGNKQYTQPHQDVFYNSYNWTQGPQQALTASGYGMPQSVMPTFLDSSMSSMSNIGGVDGFQNDLHFTQYPYMSPSQVDNVDATLPQPAAQEQGQTDFEEILQIIDKVEKNPDIHVDYEKVIPIRQHLEALSDEYTRDDPGHFNRCIPPSTSFPVSTGMDHTYTNTSVLPGMDNHFYYTNSPTHAGLDPAYMCTNSPTPANVDNLYMYVNSPTAASVDSGFINSPMSTTLDSDLSNSPSPASYVDLTRDDAKQEIHMHMDPVKQEKCYMKVSRMTNEQVASKDVDGDTSCMIVVCQPENSPNFYENLYCVIMRSKDIKMCCDRPVNHKTTPKRCVICESTKEHEFYSPLSIYSNQNLTPLSAALRTHHRLGLQNTNLIVRFLCEVIYQNPADIPRIFNRNSASSFQPYLASYPVLHNFLSLFYEDTEQS